jgi:ElaB/YqjD/DUF883 family membrane-anchored ribosome-binding protein
MATAPRTPKSENGQEDAADLEADIAQIKADLAKLMEQIRTTGEHAYGAGRRAATGGVEQIKAQGEAYYAGLRESADDLEAQVVATIREKPLTALAVAAGIGFLFALLARR